MQLIIDLKALSADCLIDIANALSKEIDYLIGYDPNTQSYGPAPEVKARETVLVSLRSQFDAVCGALESYVEEVSDWVVCPHE